MSTSERSDAVSLRAKIRHDVRSRFAAVIGLLEVMAEESGCSSKRSSIIREKRSVELCLDALLAELGITEAQEEEQFESKARTNIRVTALPTLKNLVLQLEKLIPNGSEQKEWIDLLFQEVRQLESWCNSERQEERGSVSECDNSTFAVFPSADSADQTTVVVIDDEQSILQLISLFLKQERCRVCVFSTGQDALRALRSTQCDLILLDLNMNGINGIDVLQALKKQSSTRHTPVVIITGSEDPTEHEACLRAGSAAILLKPFDKKQLLETVKQHLPKQKNSP